jgi:hypothetical protein
MDLAVQSPFHLTISSTRKMTIPIHRDVIGNKIWIDFLMLPRFQGLSLVYVAHFNLCLQYSSDMYYERESSKPSTDNTSASDFFRELGAKAADDFFKVENNALYEIS